MARRKKRGGFSGLFKPKHVYLPGTDLLRQIDIDALTDEMDLEARGAADGVASIPPNDGGTLSVAERDILGRLGELWGETVRDAKRAYEGYRSRFTALTADADIDALVGQPGAVAVTLRERSREEQDRLVAGYARVRDATQALARFKAREGITEPPRPLQKPLQKWAVLVVAGFLEFIVNVSIFAGGDEFGLAGAIMKVIVVPIANLGGCFFLTHWGARQVLRKSPVWKLIGLGGWILTLAWLFGLNLGIAHWRDSADAMLNFDAAATSIQAAWANPFGLRGYESWALFIVGCAAGIAAIWKGWTWTDPHPGYSRRAVQADQALAGWRADREWALSMLQHVRDEAVDALSDAQRNAEIAINQRPELAGRAASLADDMVLYAEYLDRVAEELVARYREANVRARKDAAPTQFEHALELSLKQPAMPALKAGKASRETAGRLATAIQQITEAFSEACARIPSLEDMTRQDPEKAAA